ncbi:MAG TPA: hypothetical protein VNY36_08715 [Bacteroidia bacterium]|jgi:hypothetical protein|nr:hypothetical protein [Bacteroidia bacterium]
MKMSKSQPKLFRNILAAAFTLVCFCSNAQKDNTYTDPAPPVRYDTTAGVAGQFSLGMRNTISAFTDAKSIGMGAGGEFRIRLGRQLNTEWFADYISTDIQGLGYRRDAHIGWSVLFYLSKNPLTLGKVTAYVLAGHCFDYTKVYSDWPGIAPGERWSSAVQGGFGIHYNITRNFDISLLSQYMMHLGTDINSNIVIDEASGQQYLNITKESGLSLEGHLLTTISLNYMLGNLWGRK